VEDEAEIYNEPGRAEMGSTAQQIMESRDQMKPEEKAQYTRQIEEDQQKLLKIGQQHLKLQQLPIGNPSPVPKRQYKKKTHGLADARGLTGAEIASKALKEREAEARRQATAQAIATHIGGDDEGIIVTVPDTPPRALGESQGGTTMTVDTLPIRLSPEHRRAATRPRVAPPPRQSHWASFSGEDAPPASIAPPRLEKTEGRPKRKRRHTDRYEESVEDGELPESQHGAIGRRG
jgi:hypothetical protein